MARIIDHTGTYGSIVEVFDQDLSHKSPVYIHHRVGVTEYGNNGIFRVISPSNFTFMSSEFAGDDTYYGSTLNESVEVSLHGGSDYVEIYSGISNYVNTNMGDDIIKLYDQGTGTSGWIFAGKGDDTIDIVGGGFWGEWGWVNGNNGSDTINNWSPDAGTVRGGKDDDLLINYEGKMDAYGDKGSDTFRPYFNFNGSTTLLIKDFQVGYDILDTSKLGSEVTQRFDTYAGVPGLTIDAFDVTYGTRLCAFLENVTSYI